MERRRLLAGLASAATAVAGCLDASGERDQSTDSQRPRPTGESSGSGPGNASHLVRHGLPQDLCSSAPVEDPGIHAVTDPAFDDDWSGLDIDKKYRPDGVETAEETDGLGGDVTVVGVAGPDDARAYPLPVLWYHEVVNDEFALADGETPVLATFCPLCNSGMVARRVVGGTPREFLVSGLLWTPPRLRAAAADDREEVFGAGLRDGETPDVRAAGNLVMYDRETGSYWSQMLARAICGPLAGSTLDLVPAEVTTWRAWRSDNPSTDVLLPPPYSDTTSPET